MAEKRSGRAVLFAHMETLRESAPAKELIAYVVSQGFSATIGSQALSLGTRAGKLVRAGETNKTYRYRLATEAELDAAQASKPLAPEPATPEQVSSGVAPVTPQTQAMTASIGAACAATSRAKAALPTVRSAIEKVLEGEPATTLEDLLAMIEGGWTRSEILSEVASGVIEGWLDHSSPRHAKDRVFWLPDELPVAEATAIAPPPAAQAARAVAVAQRPLGIRDRLEAALADIGQCLGDACEGELPHAVIKELHASTDAGNRALRLLAA